MSVTHLFYNTGFGWVCKKCENEQPEIENTSKHSRLLQEGEAEGKVPRLSTSALARWTDDKRDTLCCPRCGNREKVV